MLCKECEWVAINDAFVKGWNHFFKIVFALFFQAISECYQEKGLGRAAIKRSLSTDNVIGRQRTKSMLSKENEGL